MVSAGPLNPLGLAVAFDGFTFDPARGVLTAPEGEIVLRPKTAAVLAHLLGHAGQVVSRDAFLDAVWGDAEVGDDSLTQCIAEIRRGLGPAGAGLLLTHARRGYSLAATPRPLPAAEDPVLPVASGAEPDPAAEAPRPAGHIARGRVGWAALVVAGCGLALAAAWQRPERAPEPSPQVVAASGEPSPRAQARQLLLDGRAAQRGTEPFDVRLRASLPLFLRALELDPGLADAAAEATLVHVNLRSAGISLDPVQDLREAERLAALALAADPAAPMALSAQAAVLRQRRRFAEALVFYERAGESPVRVSDRANAGVMQLMLGDAERAIPKLRAALLEAPRHAFSPNWQVFLGLAQLMAGQPDLAAEDFLTSQQLMFRPEERLLFRLAALSTAGRLAEAQALDAELRQRDPALLARAMATLSRSDEPTFRARFATAVLEPLSRMGWTEPAR